MINKLNLLKKRIGFICLFALAVLFVGISHSYAQKLEDGLIKAQQEYENIQKAIEQNDKVLEQMKQDGKTLSVFNKEYRQHNALQNDLKEAQKNLFNETIKAFNASTDMVQKEQLLRELDTLSSGMSQAQRAKFVNLQDHYERQKEKENLYDLKQEAQLLENQFGGLTEEQQKRMQELQKEIAEREKNMTDQEKALQASFEKQREEASSTIDPSQRNENLALAASTKQAAAQARASYDVCSGNCDPRCFYKELQTCSFCPLFKTVFNTASVIAQHAINTFSGSIIKVVIIAFGIWIAFQVLAFVATVEVRDFKDLASSLITQSFVVMLVVIILQHGAMDFFNYALEPIYTTGQNLAQTVIRPDTVATGDFQLQGKDTGNNLPQDVLKACSGDTGVYDPEKGRGALPKAMGDSIICTMTLIQNRVAKVKALGNASICQSWKERFFIIPHLNYLLVGIGLWVGAMVLLLAVPFMMVDAIFEMAVAAALIPFGIGAYAFRVTRGYTKKIWETFLNSMFQFVFVSLIALMLVVAYQSIIVNSIGEFDAMFVSGQKAVLSDLLIKLPWFSTAFLEVCFVMILAWSVLNSAKEFAGEFAGSISSTSIGSSIGTMAGSFTKSAALRIAKPTAEAAAEHIGHGIRTVAVAPVHYARRAAMSYRAARIKKNGQYDEKTGQYVLKTKHWWGNKKLTLVENADGTQTINKDKIRKTRNGAVIKTKVQSTHFTVTTTTHREGGRTWSEDRVSLNSSFASELYRKDGVLNQHDLENLMVGQNVANADKINIALANEAMAQRMPNAKHNFRNHDYVSQEALYENGKFVGYIETHKDGSKSVVRFDIGQPNKNGNKRMMTTFTHIDAKGRGTTLQSDGIINKKQTFKTKDGTANGEIDEESKKTDYRLSAYYDSWFNNQGKGRVNRAMEESMFSSDEVKEAHNKIFYTANTSAEANIYEFEVYHS